MIPRRNPHPDAKLVCFNALLGGCWNELQKERPATVLLHFELEVRRLFAMGHVAR
jgi:hypothetical protein